MKANPEVIANANLNLKTEFQGQRETLLAMKLEGNLSSILRTHVVGIEKQLPQLDI